MRMLVIQTVSLFALLSLVTVGAAVNDTKSVNSFKLLVGGGGWALQFDGYNDHVLLKPEMWQPSHNATIEMWVQPLELTNSMGEQIVRWNKQGTLLAISDFEQAQELFSAQYGGGKARWMPGASAWDIKTQEVQPESLTSKGQLYHYAFVRSGRNASVYLNGQLAKTWPLDDEATMRNVIMQLPALLGARWTYTGGKMVNDDRCFGGILDELRWWGVARSPEELQQSMKMPIPADAPGLLQQWKFDEGFGETDGESYILGSGDKLKTPLYVPSPVQAYGGPVALRTKTGACAQKVLLCAMLVPAAGVLNATVTFQKAPAHGRLAHSTGILLSQSPSNTSADGMQFCGHTTYTPLSAGFDNVPFTVTATLPNGEVISASQNLSVSVSTNFPPVAGEARAIRTDGASGYASLGSFELPEAWSFSVWLKPLAFYEGANILSRHTASGSNLLLFEVNDGGYKLFMFCREGCHNYTMDKQVFPSSGKDENKLVLNTNKTFKEISDGRLEAHHLTLTVKCLSRGDAQRKPMSRVTVYVNGESIGQREDFEACLNRPAELGDLNSFPPDLSMQTPWELGEEYDSGDLGNHQPGVKVKPSQFFHGEFDQVVFWGQELSPTDVAVLASPSSGCVNDDSTTDRGGDTCSWYDSRSYECGSYDTLDFAASEQCCACGGGGSVPQLSEVIARFDFDQDSPTECMKLRLWDSSVVCHPFDVSIGDGSIPPTVAFPWSSALVGGVKRVLSPFWQIPGSTIHHVMAENTCAIAKLLASDPDGDSVSFKIVSEPSHGWVSAALDPAMGSLRYCAGQGRRNVSISFDACDDFEGCASKAAGIGQVIFHVLSTGPKLEAFQAIPSLGVLRLVFDMPTNRPFVNSSAIEALVTVKNLTDGETIGLSRGEWEEDGRALRIVVDDEDKRKWPTPLDVRLSETGGIRNAAETSFWSTGSLSAVETIICADDEVLHHGTIQCSRCPDGSVAHAGICAPVHETGLEAWHVILPATIIIICASTCLYIYRRFTVKTVKALKDSEKVVRKELETSQTVSAEREKQVIGLRHSESMLRESEQKLKTELKQLRDSMVGVRAVQHDWRPESMDVIIVIAESETSTHLAESETSTHLSRWYWQEDESRLGSHNKQDIHQPGNFVAFSGSVTAEIEEAYMMFLNFRAYNFEEPPTSCKLNLVDRIASTGTEQKAYAPESGYDYEINFLAMTQTNLKSGFVRKVFRREMSPPTPPTTSFDSCASKMPQDKPAELIGEDCLVLYQGQLVQTSRQREDGWAYGSVVFDPEPERTPIIMEGISSTSGWFPINCSALPTNAQLRGWQAAMGGHGADVLAPPIYWEQLKDPLVAQLYPVNGTELGKVSKFFLHTLTNVKIHEVSRIQSVSLWQSYAAKRQTVVQREMSTQGLSEQTAISRFEREWLFHGTTPEIVPKIVQQGFNRSFCGRNATAFGKGVYFARDASYSSGRQYSAPDSSGIQNMFLCRVVVGEFCRGKRDALTPDVRSGHQLYDATVDNEVNPSIYVTYHDAQAYPEYLVRFSQ